MEVELTGVPQTVSTGSLPGWERVDELVVEAYERARARTDGAVADYIPALAGADPEWFGLCVAEVDGREHAAGDVDVAFSIQSISKAFVYALVCDRIGHDAVHHRVGVNNTGLAFDSVIAVELHDGHPMNPMVNAGAIATTAMIGGRTPEERWAMVQTGLSRFAGRPLQLDQGVYESEAATNHRNRAMAQLLLSYGRIDVDPLALVDTYTRQCSLLVTARDVAVMGATLAHGGLNPVTGDQVVAPEVSRDTLAVLASNGLYERSGEWLFEIGLPGKSGVSGGILAVAPGKAGIGVFSPRLDSAGNSVRGQQATAHLSRSLGLNLFAS